MAAWDSPLAGCYITNTVSPSHNSIGQHYFAVMTFFIAISQTILIGLGSLKLISMIVIAIERNAVCHFSLDDEGDDNRSWLYNILCKELTEEQNKHAELKMDSVECVTLSSIVTLFSFRTLLLINMVNYVQFPHADTAET